MLFVVTAVEPCGIFLILLQKLQKYSSLAAPGLRVSVRKTVGQDLAFFTDFFRDREAAIPSTDFRRTFPHSISEIVCPASRSCARDPSGLCRGTSPPDVERRSYEHSTSISDLRPSSHSALRRP